MTVAFLLPLLLCPVLIQKRLKKEKRNKRRLQEALEEEVKLRDQAEHTLLHTASTHTGAHTRTEHITFPLWLRAELKAITAGAILIFMLNVTKPSVRRVFGRSFASNSVSLLINVQTTGHQSSAAPPHTESVTQDVDGSNHDDNRLDTKATVQGTGVQTANTASSVCRYENGLIVPSVGMLWLLDRKTAATAETFCRQMTTQRELRQITLL